MRRLLLSVVALAALAAPASALALRDAPGDGTLVVRNGEAPNNVPVVQLQITGSVIGEVKNSGRIVIDAGAKGPAPEVTGAGSGHDVSPKDTARSWASADGFKFRAVGGTFTVLVYGSGVNLFAVGNGTVVLSGMPDTPVGDGRYWLNGDSAFHSLPGTPTKQLAIGTNG
jgi:hypothetical protein